MLCPSLLTVYIISDISDYVKIYLTKIYTKSSVINDYYLCKSNSAPAGDYAAATAAGKPENFSQNKKVLLTVRNICVIFFNVRRGDSDESYSRRERSYAVD